MRFTPTGDFDEGGQHYHEGLEYTARTEELKHAAEQWAKEGRVRIISEDDDTPRARLGGEGEIT